MSILGHPFIPTVQQGERMPSEVAGKSAFASTPAASQTLVECQTLNPELLIDFSPWRRTVSEPQMPARIRNATPADGTAI